MMYFLSMAAIVAAAAAGCTKYIPYNRSGGSGSENQTRPGGSEQQEDVFTLKEYSNWGLAYLGRTDYQEADGSISRVEEFHFDYPGNAYFIVRTITDEDFASWYDSDVKSFLEGEVGDVVTLSENNGQQFYENTNMVFTSSVNAICFDMLIHGVYTTYMIEVSKEGKATGSYSKLRHEVEEETPIQDYMKWIGTWHVADSYVGYDITVSQCEANYLYYIDGWETGPAVQEQMNMDRDWLYARYRNGDGNLYFYGQYLMSYEDEALGTDVDQMFVGTYLTSDSDSNGIVDVEGADYNYDIAHTSRDEEGNLTIVPESFTFDNGFVATYHTMRYSRYCYDEQNWAHYNNSGVPTLPLVMTPLPDTKAVAAPARRISSREALRRVQLKPHVPKQVRSFKGE